MAGGVIFAAPDTAELMLSPSSGQRRVTVGAVIGACACHYGIAPGLLTEPDGGAGQRQRWIVRKRQVAMYLSRELTDLSTIQIGHFFGSRHHTTVLHACEAVKQLLAEGHDYTRSDVRALMSALGAYPQKKNAPENSLGGCSADRPYA